MHFQESVLSKLVNYTNDNSWLWGFYIVAFGTPLSFVFYTVCCSKKVFDFSYLFVAYLFPPKQEKNNGNENGLPKKTEIASLDDDECKIAATLVSSKKSDLDVKITNHSDEVMDYKQDRSNRDKEVFQQKTEVNFILKATKRVWQLDIFFTNYINTFCDQNNKK